MTDQSGMGDFIFGTLATTEDRLAAVTDARRELSSLRLERGGGHDNGLQISLSAGPDAPVETVTLYFTTDGSDPVPNGPTTHERAFTEYGPDWDTLIWGYVRRFEATIPAPLLPQEGILRCRAEGYTRSGHIYHAGGGQRYSYLLTQFSVPEWLRRAVIYQVFVDRFAPPPDQEFALHDDMAMFFGGALRGVTAKLDYFRKLGIDCLWLSPIFPSPSHHGYDSTDFQEIEPRLGTKADLKELVDSAHAMGIKILLDFIPNHVSNEHAFFKAAQADRNSPYHQYFTFTNWPDEYETFFGVKTLPQINNENTEARKYVIDSAVYWLTEFNIDGFRLDYAYGPSNDFWADYYAAVKTAKPDSAHFGEIVETPELLKGYAGRMDGTLDFHMLASVRKTFAYGTMDVEAFDDWLKRHERYFNNVPLVLPSFLDNHDMNRFLWVAKGDKRRLKLAALLQFTLANPPIIYYGTETGLSQLRDLRQGSGAMIMEESRMPMNWESMDTSLVDYYTKLIAIRHEIVDALKGSRTTLITDAKTGRYGYGYYAENGSKFDGELSVIVLLNNAPEPSRVSLDASGTWRNLFTGDIYPPGKPLAIRFEPYSGTVLMRAD